MDYFKNLSLLTKDMLKIIIITIVEIESSIIKILNTIG